MIMGNRILLSLFIGLSWFSTQATALTFDWKGTSTTWASSTSWTETGGTGDYPGSGGRTTDIVRFGMTSTFTSQPTLTSSLTIASIEFGGGFQKNGTQVTVNGATLTVGTITQDINTTSGSFTIFDYLQGTGTISCTSITIGSGTSTSGADNFLLSDVATLNVSGNITITSGTMVLAAGSGSPTLNVGGNVFAAGDGSLAACSRNRREKGGAAAEVGAGGGNRSAVNRAWLGLE